MDILSLHRRHDAVRRTRTFVFLNKRSNRAKVLWWGSNGYCLLYKRLHQALFMRPPTPPGGSRAVSIDGRPLAALLAGVEKRRRGLDG
jgi:transposase